MVEQVLNGSTLRVVLPDMRVTTLTVAGVQCPSLGRRVRFIPELGCDFPGHGLSVVLAVRDLKLVVWWLTSRALASVHQREHGRVCFDRSFCGLQCATSAGLVLQGLATSPSNLMWMLMASNQIGISSPQAYKGLLQVILCLRFGQSHTVWFLIHL